VRRSSRTAAGLASIHTQDWHLSPTYCTIRPAPPPSLPRLGRAARPRPRRPSIQPRSPSPSSFQRRRVDLLLPSFDPPQRRSRAPRPPALLRPKAFSTPMCSLRPSCCARPAQKRSGPAAATATGRPNCYARPTQVVLAHCTRLAQSDLGPDLGSRVRSISTRLPHGDPSGRQCHHRRISRCRRCSGTMEE
jgi:hypothetical protein